MSTPNYSPLYAPRGSKYADASIKSHSHYRDPIDPTQVGSGNSRVWGDASPAAQRGAIDALMTAGNLAGLSDRDMAHVPAIARHEAGFNPSAAAGTTSAQGLGQFIDGTGASCWINDSNRWDVNAQAGALVAHFQDNQRLAAQRGQTNEAYIYKYHHDGPTRDYGCLDIARREVVPRIDAMEEFVRDHRAPNRRAEVDTPIRADGGDALQAVPAEMQANARGLEHQLGRRLREKGMSEAQIEALAEAASKEAARHAGQGEVAQFMLSKDGNTVALRQEHPPLREFSVADALVSSPAEHWREGLALSKASLQPVCSEHSGQLLAGAGLPQPELQVRALA